MFFDRYEIHIQAFVDFSNGNFIISDPHLHKIILGNPSGLRPDRRGARRVDGWRDGWPLGFHHWLVNWLVCCLIDWRWLGLLADWKSGTVGIPLGRLSCWLCESSRSGCRCFAEDRQQVTSKETPLGQFWAILNDQDSPIMRQTWESQLSRLRLWKTWCFWWPRGLNIVKRMLWRDPSWPSAARARHLVATW